MYHLCAPAGQRKAERDAGTEIWLAESDDLRDWHSLGPVIRPGPNGMRDDLSCWTGSTVCTGERWLTFYTGRNRREGATQHVFVAHSRDGRAWKMSHEPLLPAPRLHPTYLAEHRRVFPAWRDPFYFRHGARHLLLITALGRSAGAPGCLALAEANHAEGPYALREPILPTGYYDQIEVAQLLRRGGRWVILFSTAAHDYAPEWAAKVGAQTGLHAWSAEHLEGPYLPLGGTGHVAGFGTDSGLYGVRIVADRKEPHHDWALGWYWSPECFDANGSIDSPLAGVCALTVAEPRPITLNLD